MIKRYTKKDNIASIALGVAIAIPLCIVAQSQRTKANTLKQMPTETVKTSQIGKYEVTEVNIKEQDYYDSLEYLAMCVEAEAGNQGVLGKALVCDVILNRVDSEQFPNDIYRVINDKGQFSVVESGVIETTIPSGETYDVVAQELKERLDYEILYFRTDHYHSFAEPAYKEGAHYFSK